MGSARKERHKHPVLVSFDVDLHTMQNGNAVCLQDFYEWPHRHFDARGGMTVQQVGGAKPPRRLQTGTPRFFARRVLLDRDRYLPPASVAFEKAQIDADATAHFWVRLDRDDLRSRLHSRCQVLS